jgi:hypothetical protein
MSKHNLQNPILRCTLPLRRATRKKLPTATTSYSAAGAAVHGLMIVMPAARNGALSRVATIKRRDAAMAAIWASRRPSLWLGALSPKPEWGQNSLESETRRVEGFLRVSATRMDYFRVVREQSTSAAIGVGSGSLSFSALCLCGRVQLLVANRLRRSRSRVCLF